MEPDGSLTHSQAPAICPSPQPYQFSTHPIVFIDGPF